MTVYPLVHHSYSSTVTQKKARKIELDKRASNIFFIKMEYVLANLEGSNFKNFLTRWPLPWWGLLRHHSIEVKNSF